MIPTRDMVRHLREVLRLAYNLEMEMSQYAFAEFDPGCAGSSVQKFIDDLWFLEAAAREAQDRLVPVLRWAERQDSQFPRDWHAEFDEKEAA